MYFFYSLALSLLFVALLPYFIYQAIRHGKYAGSFKQRLGFLPASARAGNRPVIWVHTVSVGEFNAARPLLAMLRSRLPGHSLFVSTTTMAGQELARRESPGLADSVFYFPFDWKFAVRRAIDRAAPSAVIILETELWPNFLRECSRRNVPAIIGNGRISSRSFSRYKLVGPLFRRVINDPALLIMQSEADAGRARALGANPSKIKVCGNIKYDLGGETAAPPAEPRALKAEAYEEIDRQFGLSRSPHLIIAGSTAPGEERMILDALRAIRAMPGLDRTRLVIAPRHPERFDEVAALVARSEFKLARRSDARNIVAGAESQNSAQPAADVVLLDSIGELACIYRFASVVFVGGSLVPRGGHNILEPALYAKPVVVGPHTENFREIVSDFARAEAVAQVGSTGSDAQAVLTSLLTGFLLNPLSAEAMGERARALLDGSKGATLCTVAAIEKVLDCNK